ncbi:MAG TPA: helix-turn-helix domain-containing protein [Nannocystis sp.]
MPNQNQIPAIMNITEASAAVKLHHTTLRKAIKEGRLPCSRPDGRAIRITRKQLLTWLSGPKDEPERDPPDLLLECIRALAAGQKGVAR